MGPKLRYHKTRVLVLSVIPRNKTAVGPPDIPFDLVVEGSITGVPAEELDAALTDSQIRSRLETILLNHFGRVEERLFESGLLDSFRAIELGVHLEDAFGIRMGDLELHDLASVTSIVARVGAIRAKRGSAPHPLSRERRRKDTTR